MRRRRSYPYDDTTLCGRSNICWEVTAQTDPTDLSECNHENWNRLSPQVFCCPLTWADKDRTRATTRLWENIRQVSVKHVPSERCVRRTPSVNTCKLNIMLDEYLPSMTSEKTDLLRHIGMIFGSTQPVLSSLWTQTVKVITLLGLKVNAAESVILDLQMPPQIWLWN